MIFSYFKAKLLKHTLSRNVILKVFGGIRGFFYFLTRDSEKNYSRKSLGITAHSLEAARKTPVFTGAMTPCKLS
jgi:hypothetical protein